MRMRALYNWGAFSRPLSHLAERSMSRTSAFAASWLTLCLSPLVLADAPAAAPAATPRQVQQAVERGIAYVQTESAAWLKQRKCAACHHAGLPLWSLGQVGKLGYPIDKKYLADTLENALGSREKMIAAKLIPGPKDPPDTRPLAKGVKMGTVFMAVALESGPTPNAGQKESLKQIAAEIVEKAKPDGSWDFYLSRPPINESQTTDAVWTVMALQGQTGADASPSQRAALAKAITWLATPRPTDGYQEKVLKTLVGLRTGKSRIELQPALDELFALQRPNGGWSQLPDKPSDAFATGEALYVFSLAGYKADRPEIKRAIDFLIANQKPDGSWPMTSRSSPDGKPGSAKLLTPITCGATSWAILGLAKFNPKQP